MENRPPAPLTSRTASLIVVTMLTLLLIGCGGLPLGLGPTYYTTGYDVFGQPVSNMRVFYDREIIRRCFDLPCQPGASSGGYSRIRTPREATVSWTRQDGVDRTETFPVASRMKYSPDGGAVLFIFRDGELEVIARLVNPALDANAPRERVRIFP